jgi:hypothetical protein
MKILLSTAALVMFATAALAGNQTGDSRPGGPQAMDNTQRTHLTSKQRGDIARGLVHKWAPEVRQQGGNIREWAVKLGRHIGTADAVNVQQAASMPTFDAMMGTLQGQAGVSAAKLGDMEGDLVYTPLPNGRCRVADSRTISSPLSPFVERDLDVEDTATYASQGGTGSTAGQGSANCGIPSFVAAYAVSLTILPPAGTPSGLLKIYENGKDWSEGNPVLFTLNDFGASNDVIVNSCQTCALELAIQSGSATHYVVDVVGYFIRPQATELQCVETANGDLSIAAGGGTGNAVAPACPTGYTQTATNCETTSWLMPIVYFQSGTCSARNGDSSSQTLRASRTCCRVPGR